MWVSSWLFKWQLWMNVASHISHANAFSPCRSLHDSSSDNCGWMLHHIFHMQMPSLHVGRYMSLQLTTVLECKITYFTCKWLHSMWVATWLFKWQLWLNVRSHISHANGFTPMWVSSWLFKWQLWLNVWSHILHANGFTPCGSLHDSSTDNYGWMLHHLFHMKMASLPVGLHHDSSSNNCVKI